VRLDDPISRRRRDRDRMGFALLLGSGASLVALLFAGPQVALLVAIALAFVGLCTSPLWHSGVEL